MMKMKKIFAAALVVLVASCSSTHEAKVDFDTNTEVDTSGYKTFAWLTPARIMAPPADLNPVMKLRVDAQIEEAFIAKGYTMVDDPEQADFNISYTVGSRDKIKVSSYPTTYNNGFGWGRGYYGGYYGGMYGSSMGTETRVRQYVEGNLAIDIYDVKSHQPAWHGWAVKRITSDDKETPVTMIRAVIDKVVAQF
jgi:hypothetical protein